MQQVIDLVQITKDRIISQVMELELESFFVTEVSKVIWVLNYYKLSNIEINMLEFLTYLDKLNSIYISWKYENATSKEVAKIKNILLVDLAIVEFTMSPYRISNWLSKLIHVTDI